MVALKLAIPAPIQRSFACRMWVVFLSARSRNGLISESNKATSWDIAHESGFLAKKQFVRKVADGQPG